jgi:hypothetical protein
MPSEHIVAPKRWVTRNPALAYAGHGKGFRGSAQPEEHVAVPLAQARLEYQQPYQVLVTSVNAEMAMPKGLKLKAAFSMNHHSRPN